MAALTTKPRTQTFEGEREHRSFRLDPIKIATLQDIATGAEQGEAGLKSCALGALSGASLGASAAEVSASHHREVEAIEDEDACFNAIGDLLAAGFTNEEVKSQVTLGGGATHLLALERWCDRIALRCNSDAPISTRLAGVPWRGSDLHERRQRGHRAIAHLRRSAPGVKHAAVLHIVYGWPDPMLLSASKFLRELELTVAGEELPKIAPADRDVFNLAKSLLQMGELAPLARYTAAVEARRQEMIHLEAARKLRRVDGVIPLADHRARVAAADRMLSSTDALRDGFSSPPPKREEESRAEYDVRLEQGKTDRLVLLSAVKVDADRMLGDASLAFRDAWLGN